MKKKAAKGTDEPDDKPKAHLDLDALANLPKEKELELVKHAAEEAKATQERFNQLVGVVGSDLSRQLTETVRIANSVAISQNLAFTAAVGDIAKAQLALVPPSGTLVVNALDAFKTAQHSQVFEVGKALTKLTEQWQPLYDLRLITGSLATNMIKLQENYSGRIPTIQKKMGSRYCLSPTQAPNH